MCCVEMFLFMRVRIAVTALWPWRPIQTIFDIILSPSCKKTLLLTHGSVPYITSLVDNDDMFRRLQGVLALLSKSLSAIWFLYCLVLYMAIVSSILYS